MARREERKTKRQQRESIRDKARKAAAGRERGGGLDTLKNLPQDIEFFKPKKGRGEKGKNLFSIVPYTVSIDNHPFQTVGDLWHECTYWQHKVGGTGDETKRFICLKKTEQSPHKRCPICEYREKLIKAGNDPELAEELKPKQRQLFNVIDHDDEDKGIQLFETSPHMFGFMLDDEDRAQADDFDGKFYGDSEDGLAIKARFSEGSFGGHKFAEIARIDFEEREDLSAEIMEGAVDLDAALRILTPEEMEKKFFELDTGDDSGDDDNEDEEPEERPSKKTSPKKSKRPEPEEEDDQDDDESDEDDETEEKPAPKKSSKPPAKQGSTKRKAPSRPEPEDDEDDDDDDQPSCPSGFVFGKDCDSDDACDDCELWDDCKDEQDALKATKKKR
jgi:hypothetical protein